MAYAQIEKPTDRVLMPTQTWGLGQADFQFAKGANLYLQAVSKLYFTNEGREYTKNNQILFGNSLRLGFELPFTKQSLFGIRAQSSWERDSQILSFSPYLIRYAKIKSLTFGQRLLFQYDKTNTSFSSSKSQLAGLVFLSKDFKIFEKKASWLLGFEVFKDLTKKRVGEERRFFAQTRWIFGIDYYLSQKLSFGVFSQLSTEYYFALALYDELGKEIKPDRKLNLNAPVLGVLVRYRFGKADAKSSNFPYSLFF